MRDVAVLVLLAGLCACAEGDDPEVVERLTGPSAWITIPEGDVPVADALNLIAEQSHRTFDPVMRSFDGKTWHATGARMPILQALDEVSRAAGESFVEQGDGTIAATGETRGAFLACYDGAFRVMLDTMDVYRVWTPSAKASKAFGIIQVYMSWEPHVRVVGIGPFAFEEAADDSGASLIPPKEAASPPSMGDWKGSRGDGDDDFTDFTLAAPAPAARRIACLRGRLPVLVEREAASVVFSSPADQVGKTVALGGVTARLAAFDENEGTVIVTVDVMGKLPPMEGDPVPEWGGTFILARIGAGLANARGEKVGRLHSGGDTSPDVHELQFEWDEVGDGPSTLTLSLTSKVVRRDVKIVFRDVELP